MILHLRSQGMHRNSEATVTTTVWIACSVYALIATLKGRLELPNGVPNPSPTLPYSSAESTTRIDELAFLACMLMKRPPGGRNCGPTIGVRPANASGSISPNCWTR